MGLTAHDPGRDKEAARPWYAHGMPGAFSRTLTVANQVTILRLVFVPVFAILVVGRHYRLALATFAAAAASDGIDGLVARALHQQSALGIALDPIADKILMTTAYLALAFRHVLPGWITILVISRDIAFLAVALIIILVAGYRPFPPTILGKCSTASQLATVLVALAGVAGLPLGNSSLLTAVIDVTAALTVASAMHYLMNLRSRPGPQAAPARASQESRVDH